MKKEKGGCWVAVQLSMHEWRYYRLEGIGKFLRCDVRERKEIVLVFFSSLEVLEISKSETKPLMHRILINGRAAIAIFTPQLTDIHTPSHSPIPIPLPLHNTNSSSYYPIPHYYTPIIKITQHPLWGCKP